MDETLDTPDGEVRVPGTLPIQARLGELIRVHQGQVVVNFYGQDLTVFARVAIPLDDFPQMVANWQAVIDDLRRG